MAQAILLMTAACQTNSAVKINYPGSGNNSQFAYDGHGINVRIVETVAGALSDTKQFVWLNEDRCETRNASGAVTEQFFSDGEMNAGVANFWTFDNLNSVREVTTSSGTILDQRIYDRYGSAMQLQGTTQTTYQYAQLYKHKASGLNLSLTKPYASNLGRFICRDYLKNMDQLEPNRYIYVSNQPLN